MTVRPTDLERLSTFLEAVSGFDSIPTIERVYNISPADAYICPWPSCSTKRRDSAAMWCHVHFGPHGFSFSQPTPESVFALLDKASWPEDPDLFKAVLHGVRYAEPARAQGDRER